MNYEFLKYANSTIKTTDIKGKDYAEVNQRIKVFRMLYPDGLIQTELLSLENGICTFKAMVFDEKGKLLGTGHAQEKETSSYINKTSYIENCETSAVGRALGMCGIGIDVSLASADEVQNAINNQNDTKPQSNQKAKGNSKANNNTPKAEKQQETANNASQEQPQRDKDSKVTEQEKEEIAVLINDNGIDLVGVCGAFGVVKLEDFTVTQYVQIKKNIDKLKAKFPAKEEVSNE